MFKENTKYFSITEIINNAISNSFSKRNDTENGGVSMQIINDLTYSNIWNIFVKWCVEQTQLGYLLNIYPICNMFYILDKQYAGISLKLLDVFLKDNELKFDDSDSLNFSEIKLNKNNKTETKIQKLNLLAISSELNLPKIYVQSGLNNLFKSIGTLLSTYHSCLIDLGQLGNLHSVNNLIRHIPQKIKKESTFNKRTTIKTLLNKSLKEEINKSESFTKKTSRLEAESKELNSNLKNSFNFISNSKNSILSKLKNNINLVPYENEPNIKYYHSSKVVLIPIRESDWHLKEMLNATFKRSDQEKNKNYPTLFNEYSHTKAAPFTSEKTQIPITHRIGSFYSLPLQSFIINKTSKSISKLHDEYFYKYQNIIFDLPATENEEYFYYSSSKGIVGDKSNPRKIELRKEIYKRYQNYIKYTIKDEDISDIKEEWLFAIVKMCMRAYNLHNQEKYSELLNNCIRELVLSYKTAVKKSILDYILKHPELREKLGIPILFRKLKEYAEGKVNRVSLQFSEWKRNWNLAKVRISNNLMIMSKNVTKILKYYVQNLKSGSLLILEKDYAYQHKLANYIEIQSGKRTEQKEFITDKWRKYIESVLKETKIYKDQLMIYFKSISAVMSTQLRELVIKSLRMYHEFIMSFTKSDSTSISRKNSNNTNTSLTYEYKTPADVYNNQFKPDFPFQRSFIVIEIKPSNDSSTFEFSDDLGEVHSKLLGIVNEIIKCSVEVERPDNLFIKNLEKRANLWEVRINDSEVSKIILDIDTTLKANLDMINKVTDIYTPFKFILSGQADIEKFKLANPSREEISNKIKKFEECHKNLRENFPNSLYMNMIKIDCTEINKYLRDLLIAFIGELLKYVQIKNIIGKSKELNERIDKLKTDLSKNATDEESLAYLESLAETYKNEIIPSLKTEYYDFLEWVFFYFSYDIYSVPDASKETTGGIEIHIRNAFGSMNAIPNLLETFVGNLVDKRTQYDANLLKLKNIMNLKIKTLREKVVNIREKPAEIFSDYDLALEILTSIQNETKDTMSDLKNLIKKEEFLGAYPTEDEQLELCLKDLEPMINYAAFLLDYKNANQFENIDHAEIRYMDFNNLNSIFERSDIFDISIQKIPSLKSKINRFKVEFENIREKYDLAKQIFSIIDILKYDNLPEGMCEDNSLICQEMVKFLFDKDNTSYPKKHQEFLKFLKYKEIYTNKAIIEKYKTNKIEIEKLSEEWQNILKIYESFSKIENSIFNVEIETELFREKKYTIITHDSYTSVKTILAKSIKELQDSLGTVNIQYANLINIYRKISDYNKQLVSLFETVEMLENSQLLLEKHMIKTTILQKVSPNNWFRSLKQAEPKMKDLFEFIAKYKKISVLMTQNCLEEFKKTISEANVFLNEIPYEIEDNDNNNDF